MSALFSTNSLLVDRPQGLAVMRTSFCRPKAGSWSGDAIFRLGIEEERFGGVEGEGDGVVEGGGVGGERGDGDALVAEAGVDDVGRAHGFDDVDGGAGGGLITGCGRDLRPGTPFEKGPVSRVQRPEQRPSKASLDIGPWTLDCPVTPAQDGIAGKRHLGIKGEDGSRDLLPG
jgi:hypothetical protein